MGAYADRFLYEFLHEGKYNYGIIVDYFESLLGSDDFLEVLGYMSERRGNSGYALGYTFAENCDQEDIESGDYFEDGVMFFINDADVIVDYQTFYHCLKLACEIYLESSPQDIGIVEQKMEIIRNWYGLADG